MGIFKRFCLVLFCCVSVGCKKDTLPRGIQVESFYVESVKSDGVSVRYLLSNLGYQETGVLYYDEVDQSKVSKVKAIRSEEELQLTIQNLATDTDYTFKVYWVENGEEKISEETYSVRTLVPVAEEYDLTLQESSISYDEDGNFEAVIVGKNLNNLNLAELTILLYSTELSFDYPELVSDKSYQLVVNGKISLTNNSRMILRVLYRGEEIFFKDFELISDQNKETLWLTYIPTTLRGYQASVFKNNLYYFVDHEVLWWDDREERLRKIGPGNRENIVGTHAKGTEFDGKLFFPAQNQSYLTTENPPVHYNFPQAYSYSPEDNSWTSYAFTEHRYPANRRRVENSNYFIHNNEMYLVYQLNDDPSIGPNVRPESDIKLYRFDGTSGQFLEVFAPHISLDYFHFISVNSQLYLLGLSPVYDQGFPLSTTFCVYKVDPRSFEIEEVYRGGTEYEPQTFITQYVTEYDGRIILALGINNYLSFDLDKRELSNIDIRNPVPHQYFGGFFFYNDKIHMNADINFTSARVYEVSIANGN